MQIIRILVSARVTACLLLFGAPASNGITADLSTTNETRIQHFWSAVQRSNGPVTVLSFGDSVAVDYRSIQTSLFARMQEYFGSSGVAFTGWSYKEVAGGAERIDWGPDWWADHTKIPAGGYVTWYPQMCDDVGVFWIARPGGGLFTLSATANNGATVISLLTLNGAAPVPTGCFTNVHLARATYGLRADGISGTNVVVGARLIDTTGTGICTGFLTKGGQNLGGIFNLSTNVLYPILSAINPHLVVWHMKEVADIGETMLSNRLYNLEALWDACVTNGDVVYIGTPYESRDVGAEFTPIQNRLVRQAAVRGNRAYIDCMTPCLSYEAMVQYKLLDDIVHPSPLGSSFMANLVVWPQLSLGRLALGAPFEQRPLPPNPLWMTNTSQSFPVYGWAVWTPEEGALVLKNPAPNAGSIMLDAQTAFQLASGAPKMYDVTRCRVPVATLQAGEPGLVTLNPSETVALEAHPRISLLSIETYRTNLILRWPAGQSIEHASPANGSWLPLTGVTSPWLLQPTGSMGFYRAVTN